jgi:hypothetical protein
MSPPSPARSSRAPAVQEDGDDEPRGEERSARPPARRGRPTPVVRVARPARSAPPRQHVGIEVLPLLAGGAVLLAVGFYLSAIHFGAASHPFPIWILLVICGLIAIGGGLLSLLVVEEEVPMEVVEYRALAPPPTRSPAAFPARPVPYTRSAHHPYTPSGGWRTIHGRPYRAPRAVTHAVAGASIERTRSRMIEPPVVSSAAERTSEIEASLEDDELARIHLDVVSGTVPATTRSSHEFEFDQLLNELDGLATPARPHRRAEWMESEEPTPAGLAGRSSEKPRGTRRRLCGSCDHPIAAGDRTVACSTCGQPVCASCQEMGVDRGHPGVCSMCILLHTEIPSPVPARIRGAPSRG